MFTLQSPHIFGLVISLILSILFVVVFSGYQSQKRSIYAILVIFPFSLCLISIILPFKIVWVLNYLFYTVGLFLGIKKLFKFNFKCFFNKFIQYFLSFTKLEKFLFIFLSINILSSLIASTSFTGQGSIIDAMTYHLGAPKEWALVTNGPHLNTNNPESFTAAYFEYIQYSIVMLFRPIYQLLVPLQKTHHEFLSYVLLLNGQILCAILGYILIPFLIFKTFTKKMLHTLIVLILIYGFKNLNWTWQFAKNDAFPFFCILYSYYYFKNNILIKNHKNIIFVTFLTMGIGLGAKFTNIYPMLFILIYLFIENLNLIKITIKDFSNRKLIKYTLIAAGSGIVGLLPLLLRNYLETGNPFFPTSTSIFPNIYLTDATETMHKLYSYPTSWNIAFTKFIKFYKSNPGIFVLSIFSLFFKEWKKPLFLSLLIIILAKITGEMFLWRQTSMIFLFFIIWTNQLLLVFKDQRYSLNKYLQYFLLFLLLIFAQFKPERLIKFPSKYYFVSMKQTMKNNYYAWDKQLNENLLHRNEKDFYTNYTSYFSRFPHLNPTDSREEFRTLGNPKN